jgi:hypothetical protein
MLQGPNRAPLILAVTVVLAFGAGLVAQGATGDTSGKAMILTTLPIIGLGIIAMVQWQKRWFERSRTAERAQRAAARPQTGAPVSDPGALSVEELRAALAVRSGAAAAAADARDAQWTLAGDLMRDGRIMIFAICALMIPALMLQKIELVVLAAIPIVLMAVWLAIKTVMRGGTYDKAFAALDRWLEPLGLDAVERPEITVAPRWDGTGTLRHEEVGPTVVAGTRHGHAVRISWDARLAVTTVSAPSARYELSVTDMRLGGDAPPEVRALVDALAPSPRWTKVKVSAGPEGIVIERRGREKAEAWLYDLWLAERLAERGPGAGQVAGEGGSPVASATRCQIP